MKNRFSSMRRMIYLQNSDFFNPRNKTRNHVKALLKRNYQPKNIVGKVKENNVLKLFSSSLSVVYKYFP